MSEHTKWSTKDVIKAVSWALIGGGMWASLTFQVHGLTGYVRLLDTRVSHVEQYMTGESKGKFMRQDPPNDPKP